MPLYLRRVVPVNVGRSVELTGDGTYVHRKCLLDSQEETVNRTLANIIRQLAWLGRHANDIFECLETQTEGLVDRSKTLSSRVKALSDQLECGEHNLRASSAHVDELLSPEEETKTSMINFTAEWRSTNDAQAGLFTRASRPNSIQSLYERCEGVPSLEKLQPYRDDEKICSKMYSNPEMFFEIWRNEMLEAAKKQRLQRQQQQKSRKKKSRHLNEHRKEFKGAKIKTWREVIEERELQKGTLILNKPKKTAEIPPADYPSTKRQESRRKKSQPEISGPLILKEPFPDYEPHEPVEDINRDSFMPLPPSKLDLDILIDEPESFPSPPPLDEYPEDFSFKDTDRKSNHEVVRPAPPPPMPVVNDNRPTQEPNLDNNKSSSSGLAPPPPPPPPPLPSSGSIASINTNASQKSEESEASKSTLQSAIENRKPLKKVEEAPKQADARTDLLQQIQQGMQLKKVSKIEPKTRQPRRNMNNVADVLAAVMDERFASIQGDEDSGSDMDIEGDWDDEGFD